MRRIDMKALKQFGLIAAISAMLGACGSNPTAPETKVADTPAPVLDENGQRVIAPNPYLADTTSVPAAAQQALVHARQYFEAQQYTAAETELQQLVAQWPELSGAWLNLAKIQLKLKQPEQAENSLKQSVTANKKNVFAWNSLGVLLRDQGRFDEARKAYESALVHWPDFAIAHRNLGILFDLYLHQPKRALHHYREARALEPEEDRALAGWIVDLERRL